LDTEVNMATDSTSGVLLLNGTTKGTNIDNRIARDFSLHSLELNILSLATAATGVDQQHRVMVVRDKQPNGAALTAAVVLSAVTVSDFPNVDNLKRFVILLDKRLRLNATGEAGSEILWRSNLNLGGVLTHCNTGNAGTIADIVTNSLYLIVIGSKAAGATAGLTYGKARLKFYA
jgi:hypothetical protein